MDHRTGVLLRVKDIIREITKSPELLVLESTPLGVDSEWSSLTHLEIMMEVEERFDTEFEIEDFDELPSIGAVVDLLMKLDVA